jgi:c-di-GMP-related signal transduction protein
VRHALAILGEREVWRWVRLGVTLSAGQHKSSEVVLSALVRARFCELLSPKTKHGESSVSDGTALPDGLDPGDPHV